MTVERLELKSNPGATLTAYLLDTSKEMPNMTDRPVVLVIPGGGYYMCSDREAEPIAMAFAVHGYNTFVLRYTVGEGKDFKMPLDDAEEALTAASDKFIARFIRVEQLARERGIDMESAPLEKLDELWDEAKAESRK